MNTLLNIDGNNVPDNTNEDVKEQVEKVKQMGFILDPRKVHSVTYKNYLITV